MINLDSLGTPPARQARRQVAEPTHGAAGRARVAVVCDMLEENWHSMNLVADSLMAGLEGGHADEIAPARIRPPMRRRFSRSGVRAGRRFNADRLLNRFWNYPRHLARSWGEFDVFHLVDHSYSQLVHYLPAERTVVTCHDLDTFRCLLEPSPEPRPRAFRMMAKRVLDGLRKAARVTCDSAFTRDELLAHRLVQPDRVEVVYNGVSPVFSPLPDRQADPEVGRLLGPADAGALDLLHVGSVIRRKRIDILLRVFQRVREEFPRARLVRVGGRFDATQLRLVEELGLTGSVVVMPFLNERMLAAVYRRAALLLQPSEREGFGLPVVEAIACGLPVLASDLPVLREVGGAATSYRAVGDVEAWAGAAVGLLKERREDPASWDVRKAEGVMYAVRFSWAEYARRMVSIYKKLL